jgi:hypothetical protein
VAMIWIAVTGRLGFRRRPSVVALDVRLRTKLSRKTHERLSKVPGFPRYEAGRSVRSLAHADYLVESYLVDCPAAAEEAHGRARHLAAERAATGTSR